MSENNIDDIFNLTAGKILKKYRESKNLSLEELAKKMKTNISRQSLFKYENGKARLKTNIFMDICYALNINPKDVFNQINEQTSLISKQIHKEDDFAKATTEFLIGLDYNSFLHENDLQSNSDIVLNETEQLFNKIKHLLTDEERKKLTKIIEEKRKNNKWKKN